MNNLQQAKHLGQAVWIDYLRRGLIASGEFAHLVEQGISGVTTNPTIFEKAINGSTDYDEALLELARAGKSPRKIYEELVLEDIKQAADVLSPVYEMTEGDTGYVSLEVNPLLAYDTEGTVKEAKRLFKKIAKPNVMIKVPATEQGIKAIRILTASGINVNATLLFSPARYRETAEAFINGLKERKEKGHDISRVFSVASFFLSRIDTKVDELLLEKEKEHPKVLDKIYGKTALACAKLAYKSFTELFGGESFKELEESGGRRQKLLWASTSIKNPAFNELHYVNALLGDNTVCTMPPAVIREFLHKGQVKESLPKNIHGAEKALLKLEEAGINLSEVTEQLLAEGVDIFTASFNKLIDGLKAKIGELLEERRMGAGENLGKYLYDVETALEELNQASAIERMWNGDHTVWGKDPHEIADRLGWLTIPDIIQGKVEELELFAQEVKDEGYKHIVLLGMGGSSLGAEVLRSLYKTKEGYPELIVLDSIIPEAVLSVSAQINPAKTLFIVSSKSGDTMETNLLYSYFKHVTEDFLSEKPAGRNFAAVTDEHTPLEKLALKDGFRAVFLDPFDIGGRYSGLSYFGLLPAVLMGIDIGEVLERAEDMSEACQPCVPIMENPGAFLGATMGVLAQEMVNKLTLITSPKMERFGLWVEQLLAESTGKDLKGIVPVTTEPLMDIKNYSEDRFFVYLRLKGDDNKLTDKLIEGLKKAGKPVMTLKMEDEYDIGAEFFRWQFAVAVAGSVMGVNPFNQPDVQRAKEESGAILSEYKKKGKLPSIKEDTSLKEILESAESGNYLAIMMYSKENKKCTEAVASLRRKITEKYGIATTFGYGPRFLHSTGQLYKGGPDTGLFLQIVTEYGRDIPAKEEGYSFGVAANAQAIGDYRILKASGRKVSRLKASEADVETAIYLTGELI